MMRTAATLLAALALALIAFGCGDDDDGGGDSGGEIYGGGPAATASPPGSAGSGVVSVDANPDLGRILVDAQGNTLYLFEKDKGGKSACYGACAGVWPPYTADGEPRAENGAEGSRLGTTERSDGSTQVTYAGFPLYLYVGDKSPGDAEGNDFEQFGAEWYALTPEGEHPED